MALRVFVCFLGFVSGQAAIPRKVRVSGTSFVLSETGATIVLGGPNVVVKGPPYLPSVRGDTICRDIVDEACRKAGTCTSCSTFNQADIDHIKSLGWNFIRLGVVWAGAQPRDENALDPDFVRRLHALLNLTDANGIHVMLDNHGDMVGTAGCGNGVPMWLQKKAAPQLIGMPLTTGLPYNLFRSLRIEEMHGYELCAKNNTMWLDHAGDPNYNLLNKCCSAINDGNSPRLGFTKINVETMKYLMQPGDGRDYFVRFWRLMADAVKGHPSAFAAELMNEPITLHRKWMFDTWRACAEAIHEVVPDMSVSVCDIGEGSVLPALLTNATGGFEDISHETAEWIKASDNVFYSWHYGGEPYNVERMRALSRKWDVPTFGTELGCDQFDAAKDADISHSYWHYSSYCNTGYAFANQSVHDTFGACILGWASGGSSKCVKSPVIDAISVPILL